MTQETQDRVGYFLKEAINNLTYTKNNSTGGQSKFAIRVEYHVKILTDLLNEVQDGVYE